MSHHTRNIILTLDIGSSSIRVGAYEYTTIPHNSSAEGPSLYQEDKLSRQIQVRATGCNVSRQISTVNPNSGSINLWYPKKTSELHTPSDQQHLFDLIDSCIDEMLHLIREYCYKSIKDAEGITSSEVFRVIGISFSSFVMNLVGVDTHGEVLDGATLSYACNSDDVVEECNSLKRTLGTQRTYEMYQQTGAPLHNSYAIGQFRVFYEKERKRCLHESKIYQWLTISSLCVARWIGHFSANHVTSKTKVKFPISTSEASWTGLLNFRKCVWDQVSCSHLPQECRDALPPVIDFDDYLNINSDGNKSIMVPLSIQEYKMSTDGTNLSLRQEKNPYWERWPELRGTKIQDVTSRCERKTYSSNQHMNTFGCTLFLGIGDGACASYGSKCTVPQRVSCTIGTSAALRVTIPHESEAESKDKEILQNIHDSEIEIPRGLFCYRINKSNVVIGGALTDGGSIVQWARQLMNLQSDDAFQSCLADTIDTYEQKKVHFNDMKATSDQRRHSQSQIGMIPFLSGERSTGFRGGATGCIFGISRETKSSDLLCSCFESVILRINAILELLSLVIEYSRKENDNRRGESTTDETIKSQDVVIIASGNALDKNSLWRQMLADCTGRVVIQDCDTHESSSRGAALLASMSFAHVAKTFSSEGDCHQRATMVKEKLSVLQERIPDMKSIHMWKSLKVTQEDAINCVSPMWNK